jgi:S1-C subfamily serine protease
MMRENESGNGDDWPGPYDYISPRAMGAEDTADQAPAAGDHQDTVAFGDLADEAGGPGQGSYIQRGNLDQWYSSDPNRSRYGRYAGPGSRGGYGSAGGTTPASSSASTGGASAGEWGTAGGSAGGYGSGSGGGSAAGWGSAGGGGPAGGYGSGGGGWDPGPPPRRTRRRGHLLVYLTVAVLAAGVGAALTVAFDRQGTNPPAGDSSSAGIPSPHDNATSSGSALNQLAVERKVVPGLVDITSTLKYASETAEGTGMILSPSGLVLTNNHVIDGATKVQVALADNASQTYLAQVVGYDSTADVALLRIIGSSGLATVSFGNSSQVRVGTPVLALGDAEGRGGVTPAAGEISGLDRSIQASDEGSGTTEDLNHMLETNAQIQQGDSGGALANNAGQVIGMVTAANTGSDGQPGSTTGFAIPIDTALLIAGQIANHQASSTVYIGLPGFLGVEVAQSDSANPRRQAADERSGDNQGGSAPSGTACVADGQQPAVPSRIAPANTGALILGILCGTAAQSRGLAPGDVIISVDGQAVTTPDSLTAITAKYHPGNVVSVGWEDIHGSRHTTRVTLGDGPPR